MQRFLGLSSNFLFVIGIPVSWKFLSASITRLIFSIVQPHNMSLNKTSPPCHQGLTPPGSPTESSTPQPTVEDLKHLFENVMHDIAHRETPDNLVFQEHTQPGPDMAQLRLLLVKVICNEYSSPTPSATTKSDQSCSASNGQAEDVHVADHSGLQRPICTTQDDSKSFEQWAVIQNCGGNVRSPTILSTEMADIGLVGTRTRANTR
jgi:hypothetical protein